MNSTRRAAGGGSPRRRLVVLTLLLVVSLGLGGGLALQAIQTSRRSRRTAERALNDYAGFAAFILASRAYRDLGGMALGVFTSWPPRGVPVAPGATACPAGTLFFEQGPGAAGLRTTGQAPPALVAFLRDTLQNAMPLLAEAGWRFRFIAAPGPDPQGFMITSYQAPAGGSGLRGFSVCLGGDHSPFRQVELTERALPPALTGNLPADSMFSVTVVSGRSRSLYACPVTYPSPYRGSARLGAEFGDLTLDLVLRADLADRLVIGGIPSSSTPLAAGLLGLSTLLAITALLQLRREYELIEMRSDFVSNVSHELRTPLSQILIFTELLKLGRLRTAAERSRSLSIIDQEVRRLIRLVENVLQFSRVRSARRSAGPALGCAPMPLALAVQETVDAFRPLADARGVVIQSDVPPSAVARADRGALRQILLNLLDNAVKYGPPGQTVTIRAAAANDRTRITVEDQGPGIPPEDRERIWEGYYRLPREARSAVAGSGIGLAVVRSLTSAMGGAAWVEEGAGGGTRVVVDLPAGGDAA